MSNEETAQKSRTASTVPETNNKVYNLLKSKN